VVFLDLGLGSSIIDLRRNHCQRLGVFLQAVVKAGMFDELQIYPESVTGTYTAGVCVFVKKHMFPYKRGLCHAVPQFRSYKLVIG
jgi:hypothetical protein